MRLSSHLAGVALIVGLFALAPAHAAPAVYFGLNTSPAGEVSGDPLTAASSFQLQLSSIRTENFETFTIGDSTITNLSPVALNFVGPALSPVTAEATGSLLFPSTAGLSSTGAFNTTAGGSKFLDATGSVTITFDTPITAFGFYGTDMGDFSESALTVKVFGRSGIELFSDTRTEVAASANGSLLFWGFVDSDVNAAYNSVQISTNSTGDVFGVDDLKIGVRGQTDVPEPGSLALVALSLGLLSAVRRRKR